MRAPRAELVATRFPLLAAALPSIAERTLARPDPAGPPERDRTVLAQSLGAMRTAHSASTGTAQLPEPAPAPPMHAGAMPHGSAAAGSIPYGAMPYGSLPPGAPHGPAIPAIPYGLTPAGTMLPGAIPPGATFPGAIASGAMPPGAMPPGAIPQATMSFGTMPHGTMPYGSVPQGYAPAMAGGHFPHPPAVPVAAAPWPVTGALPHPNYPARPRQAEDASLASVFHALSAQPAPQPAATPQAGLHDLFLTLGR